MHDFQAFEGKASELNVNGIMISQGGELIFERHWQDDCRRNIYSASKSFTSAAVGIAIGEGLLSLGEPLTEAFPDDLPAQPGENLKRATVRDLLTMCLGQEKASLMGGQRPYIEQDDWAKLSLEIPFVDQPGTRFVYNNVGPYLAGVLVQRRCGTDLMQYLGPRLLRPLGIHHTMWEMDPKGYTFGAGGLFLTVRELHRFGELYLAGGLWDGRQLIPADWVRDSTTKQADNSKDEYGYGYLFWGGVHNSFRADGKYGQLSILFRDRDAVVTVMCDNHDSKALMDAIYGDIYPEL